MVTCQECGRENQDGTKICVYCGSIIEEAARGYVATRALGDTDFEEGVPKWGTARFSSKMNLIINVLNTDKKFAFDPEEIDQLIIGRKDPETGESPEVDLLEYGALEKGVSRRHASVLWREGSIQIMDNGSPNGTFLNGQRLVPHQARVLRDGDDVRLGHLVLRINFVRV